MSLELYIDCHFSDGTGEREQENDRVTVSVVSVSIGSPWWSCCYSQLRRSKPRQLNEAGSGQGLRLILVSLLSPPNPAPGYGEREGDLIIWEGTGKVVDRPSCRWPQPLCTCLASDSSWPGNTHNIVKKILITAQSDGYILYNSHSQATQYGMLIAELPSSG